MALISLTARLKDFCDEGSGGNLVIAVTDECWVIEGEGNDPDVFLDTQPKHWPLNDGEVTVMIHNSEDLENPDASERPKYVVKLTNSENRLIKEFTGWLTQDSSMLGWIRRGGDTPGVPTPPTPGGGVTLSDVQYGTDGMVRFTLSDGTTIVRDATPIFDQIMFPTTINLLTNDSYDAVNNWIAGDIADPLFIGEIIYLITPNDLDNSDEELSARVTIQGVSYTYPFYTTGGDRIRAKDLEPGHLYGFLVLAHAQSGFQLRLRVPLESDIRVQSSIVDVSGSDIQDLKNNRIVLVPPGGAETLTIVHRVIAVRRGNTVTKVDTRDVEMYVVWGDPAGGLLTDPETSIMNRWSPTNGLDLYDDGDGWFADGDWNQVWERNSYVAGVGPVGRTFLGVVQENRALILGGFTESGLTADWDASTDDMGDYRLRFIVEYEFQGISGA